MFTVGLEMRPEKVWSMRRLIFGLGSAQMPATAAAPAALGYCAGQRQMDAFGVVLFLAVMLAAWSVDHAGISMTLAMPVVAASMITTPLMVKAGAALAERLRAGQNGASPTVNANLEIESTLTRGRMLLQDLGVSEQDVSKLVSRLRDDDYALVRAGYPN